MNVAAGDKAKAATETHINRKTTKLREKEYEKNGVILRDTHKFSGEKMKRKTMKKNKNLFHNRNLIIDCCLVFWSAHVMPMRVLSFLFRVVTRLFLFFAALVFYGPCHRSHTAAAAVACHWFLIVMESPSIPFLPLFLAFCPAWTWTGFCFGRFGIDIWSNTYLIYLRIHELRQFRFFITQFVRLTSVIISEPVRTQFGPSISFIFLLPSSFVVGLVVRCRHDSGLVCNQLVRFHLSRFAVHTVNPIVSICYLSLTHYRSVHISCVSSIQAYWPRWSRSSRICLAY